MKFEDSTLIILKNFATINPTLFFHKGNVLKTRSVSRTLGAKATLKQDIPKDFAIFDLSRFLNTVSLFQEPTITLEDNFCIIKQKGTAVRFTYADPRVVNKKNVDWDIEFPREYITFTLKATDYSAVLKGMAVMGLSEVAIVGDGKRLAFRALDAKGKTTDIFNIVIGETTKKFRAVISADNLKIIPQDYQVSLSDQGMAHFKAVNGTVEYWICFSATESEFA